MVINRLRIIAFIKCHEKTIITYFCSKDLRMQQNKTSVIIAVLLVLVAAISRVLLYPNYNFSPMVGMAIFAGATFTNKKLAFALPIVSMLLSDIMLEMVSAGTGFWGWGQLVGYGIFALITVLAFSLKKVSVPKVIGYSLVSSVIFFVLSNLSFFLIDNPIYHRYTQDFTGFIDCYVEAIPFFRTSIAADLVYSGILFGTYYLAQSVAVKKAVA
jgi:hypothetical protein